MKTLYESMLDDEETLINQSDKRFDDMCSVECLELFDGSYDEVEPTTMFNTSNIHKYCKRNKLDIESGWSLDSDHTNVQSNLDDMDWLRTAIMSVPYIGFEQNILVLLRGFLKPKYKIHLVSSRRNLNASKSQYKYDGSIFFDIVSTSTKKLEDVISMRIWYDYKH